jgi:hypothetical protein
MGDSFQNIHRSIIINRSQVENSITKLAETGEANATDIMSQISRIVEASQNQEAGDLFNQFTEELQKPAPRKSLLRRSWDNLMTVLPAVGEIAGATEAVAKLFN